MGVKNGLIAYKDFDLELSAWLSVPQKSMQAAVDAANAWIAEQGVAVVNVETKIRTGENDGFNHGDRIDKEIGVRVWYTA